VTDWVGWKVFSRSTKCKNFTDHLCRKTVLPRYTSVLGQALPKNYRGQEKRIKCRIFADCRLEAVLNGWDCSTVLTLWRVRRISPAARAWNALTAYVHCQRFIDQFVNQPVTAFYILTFIFIPLGPFKFHFYWLCNAWPYRLAVGRTINNLVIINNKPRKARREYVDNV